MAIDKVDQLQVEYQNGKISLDEYMIYQISRLTSHPSLPQEYRILRPVKCGSHVIKSLMENHHLLSSSTKQIIADMGVDFSGAFPRLNRPSGLDESYESDIFRFHYTLSGIDAVDPTDNDNDGIPDYINMVIDAFHTVYISEIDMYGYTEPPSDDWYSGNGGNGLYDVYILNLGSSYYGFTIPEEYANRGTGDNEKSLEKEKNAFTSYMEIRNNYRGFPNTELENIQVTAAHEFFHAIQYGYDGWEDIWLLEATATWMEDEIFDDVNDIYQYLKIWFNEPHIALDYDSDSEHGGSSYHWYGSFIFFQYISEHLGGHSTIRMIFEQSRKHNSALGDFSIQTIDETLNEIGSSFEEALNAMAIANHILSSDPQVGKYSYEEAEDYRKYGIHLRYEETIFLSEIIYEYVYDQGKLMRNATHYIELTAVNAPIQTAFYPTDISGDFQTNTIIQTTSKEVSTYGVGSGSTVMVPVPNDAESVVIAIVTDRNDNKSNDYSLLIIPEIPLPKKITLYQNFPNPFNEKTTFRFFLPEVQPVTLTIFDLLGRKVGNVYTDHLREGFNDVVFEARHLPSGVYFVQLKSESKIDNRKITLVK